MSDTDTTILHDRFEVLDELGQGGQGHTFLARDRETDQEVVVKELTLGHAADWKAIELFEREGKALGNLSHPAIPAYVDTFHLEDGSRFFLVQEYIDGEDLRQIIDRRELMDEDEARAFLLEVLGILEYLHGLSPPVIHRDIKPSNIMRRRDGAHALIDFGAVQALSPDTVGGSTIVGTTGYMPPEQLMGRSVAATDLYALAATVIHAITGIHPANLPMERMRLQFRDVAWLSEELADVLDGMLEPTVDQRFQSAREVLAALQGGAVARRDVSAPPTGGAIAGAISPRVQNMLGKNPSPHPVSIVYTEGDCLQLHVPPLGQRATYGPAAATGLAAFAFAFVGCFADAGGLCCLGTLLLFVGVPVAYFIFGRKKPTSETLNVSSAGVEFIHAEVDSKTGEEARTGGSFIPLAELRNVYLHFIDKQAIEHAQQTTGSMPPNMFQKPGIIFVDGNGARHTFGSNVITKGKAVTTGNIDTSEIRWLHGMVEAHLADLAGAPAPAQDASPLQITGSRSPAAAQTPSTPDGESW